MAAPNLEYIDNSTPVVEEVPDLEYDEVVPYFIANKFQDLYNLELGKLDMHDQASMVCDWIGQYSLVTDEKTNEDEFSLLKYTQGLEMLIGQMMNDFAFVMHHVAAKSGWRPATTDPLYNFDQVDIGKFLSKIFFSAEDEKVFPIKFYMGTEYNMDAALKAYKLMPPSMQNQLSDTMENLVGIMYPPEVEAPVEVVV